MAEKHIDNVTGVETTGHVWDNDLRGLNQPVPAWGLWTALLWVMHPSFAFVAPRPGPLALMMPLTAGALALLLCWRRSRLGQRPERAQQAAAGLVVVDVLRLHRLGHRLLGGLSGLADAQWLYERHLEL